jgi:hypothetical protein
MAHSKLEDWQPVIGELVIAKFNVESELSIGKIIIAEIRDELFDGKLYRIRYGHNPEGKRLQGGHGPARGSEPLSHLGADREHEGLRCASVAAPHVHRRRAQVASKIRVSSIHSVQTVTHLPR